MSVGGRILESGDPYLSSVSFAARSSTLKPTCSGNLKVQIERQSVSGVQQEARKKRTEDIQGRAKTGELCIFNYFQAFQ